MHYSSTYTDKTFPTISMTNEPPLWRTFPFSEQNLHPEMDNCSPAKYCLVEVCFHCLQEKCLFYQFSPEIFYTKKLPTNPRYGFLTKQTWTRTPLHRTLVFPSQWSKAWFNLCMYYHRELANTFLTPGSFYCVADYFMVPGEQPDVL